MSDGLRYDWINCQCGHLSHSARLCVEKDQPTLRLEVFMPPVSFWQRLKTAVRYLFKLDAPVVEIYIDGKDVLTLYDRLNFTSLIFKIKQYKQAKVELNKLKTK